LSLLEWLLRLPEPSKAIVTTRRYLPDFRHGTWIVELEGMTQTESLELISNRLRALRILELVPDITQLAPLFEVTGGNPKALEVATGLLKHTRQLQPIIDDLRTARGDLFDELFCRAWDGLSEEERDIMLAAPMFIGSSSKAALSAVAGVEGPVFDRALEHLQDLSLLNIHQSNLDEMPRYALHPLMRAFVQQKLHDEPHMHDTGRQRWVRYFIDLAASHLMNNRIEQPYWNTLILTDESIPAIDTELSGILDVLTWLQEQDKAQELLTLTLLIVHYLGRRAFFKPRLRFVQAAADAAHNLGEYNTEALLRIDALGWTYTEAGDYGQAERELQAGLHIAASLDAPDDRENLLALANAFLARVYAYQQAFEQAANHLQVALAAECQPIIRFRVLLTAGDVGHERRDYQAASRYYETILDLGAAHPDAGFDLGAIHHRWGLTLLQQGKLQEAEAAFNQFSRRVHQAKYRIREELKRYRESPATHYFAVEAIAAKHSAILLAAAEGNVTQAYMWAQEAKDELLRLNIKHRLLDQIEECLTMLTVTPDKEDVQQ
jgi:tetratricopeptide (TPR) repeat protein